MSYDRRAKLLAAAKEQMRENGIEPSRNRVEWNRSAQDEGFGQGERSAYKTQKNLKRRVARGLNKKIRTETADAREERGTDWQGKDWVPMPEGTLVQFVKDTWARGEGAGRLVSKGTIATVIREIEEQGQRYVDILVGADIRTVSKSAIEEF